MVFYTVTIKLPDSPILAGGSKDDVLEAVYNHILQHGVIITAEAVPPEQVSPKEGITAEEGADFSMTWRPLDATRPGSN